MRALEDLVRAGKVLYPALSNHAAWQTQLALGLQERDGWARLQAIQPMYNLVKRQAEVEILPMAQANGSPSSLTARPPRACSRANTAKQSGRLVTNKMYEARYGEPWMHEVAEKFVAFCKQRGPASGERRGRLGRRRIRRSPRRSSARATRPAPGLARLAEDRDDARRCANEIAALSRTPPPATDRAKSRR